MKKSSNSGKVTPAQLNEFFDALRSKKESVEKNPPYDLIANKDKTRSMIAKTFVWGYFVGLGLVFVVTLLYNLIVLFAKLQTELLDVKSILMVVTSSIGSGLGFVVGYYFKGQEEK